MEKTNDVNPGVYLCSLKQKISETMKGMSDLGINNQSLTNSLKDALRKVDSVVHNDIKKALLEKFSTEEFGECKWNIKIDNYIVPTLVKGRRNEYKYIIKNITWENGPSIHEVHYFIMERFMYYLVSKEYDSRLYTRNIPGIEKRYSSTFIPLPINHKEFGPIEVFISRIVHKINEKEMKQYYKLQVVDNKYQIHKKVYDEQKKQSIVQTVPIVQNIDAKTKEGLFLKLQERLEGVFYMRENTPESREAYKQLMKNQIIQAAAEPAPTPLVRPPPTGGGDPEHDEEGQGLSGTDETDVYDDASIPTEEPNFDEGGLPPTPESIDHNYHDDQNPELVKDFDEESGASPDSEEPGEDPAEEAAETPEEEAAEEASEPPESSEAKLAGSKGFSISDLMEFDHKQNQHPVELVIRN